MGQALIRKAVNTLARKFGGVLEKVIKSEVSMLCASGFRRRRESLGCTVARQTIKLVLNTFPYEGSVLLPTASSGEIGFHADALLEG